MVSGLTNGLENHTDQGNFFQTEGLPHRWIHRHYNN